MVSLRPETVDEFSNEYTPIVHPLSPWRGNINEHNMVIFYKTWKKCHEIELTKNKMDLNKSKMKKHNSLARARA